MPSGLGVEFFPGGMFRRAGIEGKSPFLLLDDSQEQAHAICQVDHVNRAIWLRNLGFTSQEPAGVPGTAHQPPKTYYRGISEGLLHQELASEHQ